MFRSNQSPIDQSSPHTTKLLDEDLDEERGRSSIDSIEPLPTHNPATPFSRARSRADSAGQRMWCRMCPYFHVSLTRHFRRTSLVLIILGLMNIILCTYYAYVDSNQNAYGDTDWQACIVAGEEALASLGYNTRFSLAAAGAGQQTLTFSLLAAVTLYRALSHPEWLVSTLAFVFYAFIGCFCYFSFAPAIPFPTSLTANVFTLMFYVKKDMYDDVQLGGNSVNKRGDVDAKVICETAYSYNLMFMVVQYVSIAMVGVLFFIGCLAESRRRKIGLIADQTTATPHPGGRANRTLGNTLAGISFATWPMLKATNMPMLLALVEFGGFFTMLYGKNKCAYTALNAATALTHSVSPTFFPFAAGGLDIVTILFVVSAMAVIRGTTRQRVSAFRLAAFTSFLHVILSWPSVVGGWKFSTDKGLWKDDCDGYFIGKGNWFNPDDDNAHNYCSAVRTALIGQLITFVCMHFSIAACVRCYIMNRDHPLELFDPNPPAEARTLLFRDQDVVVSR